MEYQCICGSWVKTSSSGLAEERHLETKKHRAFKAEQKQAIEYKIAEAYNTAGKLETYEIKQLLTKLNQLVWTREHIPF